MEGIARKALRDALYEVEAIAAAYDEGQISNVAAQACSNARAILCKELGVKPRTLREIAPVEKN